MRALVLNTQMEPAGAQRMAAAVFDHLGIRGHQAEWWSWYLKRPAYEGLPGVYCLSETPPQSPLQYARILTRFVARLREFKPDVIFGFTHYANTLGLASGCLVGVPVRIASQQNLRDSYPWAVRAADSILGTLGIYSTNVMCSRAVLESFSRNPMPYRDDVMVIPNGSKQDFPPRTGREQCAAKEAFGLMPADKLVLAVGRLSPQKRHHILIDAMNLVPHARLLIAGEGELRPELESMITALRLQKRVQLLGNVSPDRVETLLAAADVFAMASEFEGLSLALVEAMAVGLPIVASDIAPIRDVVVDEDNRAAGILVETAAAEDWAGAILQMIGTPEARQDYGRLARERARAFDIDASALQYITVAESRLAAC